MNTIESGLNFLVGIYLYTYICMYNCTYSHCYSIYYFISKSLFLWPPSSPYNETKALIINTWRIEVSLSQPRFGLPIKIEVPIYLNKHHVWVWFYSIDDWICIELCYNSNWISVYFIPVKHLKRISLCFKDVV